MMKHFLIAALLIVFSAITFAQQGDITGAVKAEDGTPLPGATVQIKGTSIGTVTNIDGNYSLSVAGVENPTLIFSYVGYMPEEVQVSGQTIIDMKLITDIEAIEGVIVVGYGTMKKSVVTAAIAKVTSEDLQNGRSVNVGAALQGKTAGVTVAQTSGSPGSESTVRIRGVGTNKNADPIYIVDGMRTTSMDYLNVNDIESIEVLKDAASAAIYGAQGANGVILITTKSGKKGEKGKVSYNNAISWQKIVTDFRTLNDSDYIKYYLEAKPSNNLIINEASQIGSFNTDWINEITKNTALMQKHDLSVSGRDDNGGYYFSGSYLDQKGPIGGDHAAYQRFAFTANADRKLNKWLTVGTKVNYTHKVRNGLSENSVFGSAVGNALMMDPLFPVYTNDTNQIDPVIRTKIRQYVGEDWTESVAQKGDDGYYGLSKILVSSEMYNPVALINLAHQQREEDKILAGVFADIKFLKDFSYHTGVNIDYNVARQQDWTARHFYTELNKANISSIYKQNERDYTWKIDNYLSYNKSIGANNLGVVLGTTAEDHTYNFLYGSAGAMVKEEPAWAYLRTQTDTLDVTNDDFNEQRLESYFGRVNYDYKGIVMATATLRADGSSKFGPENKFGYFPSFSLGWNVTQMSFWNVEAINSFKLRASWGRNGNLSSLNDFQYVSVVSQTGFYYLDAFERTLPVAEPEAISNPALKWETSQQLDIGTDLQLFRNKVSLTVDFYNKKTIDLLMQGQFPQYVGNNMPWVNAGDVKNTGVEIEVGGHNTFFSDLKVDLTASASYNKNKVISIGGGEPIDGATWGVYGPVTRFEEGYPAWYFYGYKTDGIFNSPEEINAYVGEDGITKIQPSAKPGDLKMVDVNDDGRITNEDKTMIGNPYPEWSYGLTLNIQYKGIDFSIFTQGTVGNDVAYLALRNDRDMLNKPQWMYDDRWTEENHSQEWFRASSVTTANFTFNDYYVFDGSYYRIKNITLGYTLPEKIMNKVGIDKFRIYVSAENLKTFTKYPGMEPEVGGSAAPGVYGNYGCDFGFYPSPRIITVGVNVDF